MMGQYLKGVMLCFGAMVFFWLNFEWPVAVFGLMIVGCLFVPLVYCTLEAKFSKPQTEEARRKKLKLELLKGVAYKLDKPRLISSPDSHPARLERQKK